MSLPRSRISTSCTSDGEWPELPKLIKFDIGILEMVSVFDIVISDIELTFICYRNLKTISETF